MLPVSEIKMYILIHPPNTTEFCLSFCMSAIFCVHVRYDNQKQNGGCNCMNVSGLFVLEILMYDIRYDIY